MSELKIIQEETKERDTLFLTTYIEMENASLFFLSERERRLGTLAIAIPQKERNIGLPLSSILLGDRNVIITRILAERLASKMNKISLVSVFIRSIDEKETGPILFRILEKVIQKL